MMRGRPGRRRWVLEMARWYGRRRIERTFDGLFVDGLAEAREQCAKRAVIIAMNHVCWWDAFVALLVDQALGSEGYCLMDAENLGRLPFFGWLGAVPLDRARPRVALTQLKEHARLLDRPRRALWIFPQGRQRPSHLRPLGLERGVGVLAGQSGALVLPLALSYGWREAQEPTITASFGAPCDVARCGPPEALERSLIAGLDRNDQFITAGRGAYQPIVASRGSTNVPWRGRLLARLVGGSHA